MIIYNSGFLSLEYDPGTDILTVNLPPVSDILVPEISKSFEIIVEHVRNYDIKRLLFNAQETQVEVQENEFTPIISEFAQSLTSTRIEKIARVVSTSLVREHVVKKVFKDDSLPIQFQTFDDNEAATDWLIE